MNAKALHFVQQLREGEPVSFLEVANLIEELCKRPEIVFTDTVTSLVSSFDSKHIPTVGKSVKIVAHCEDEDASVEVTIPDAFIAMVRMERSFE